MTVVKRYGVEIDLSRQDKVGCPRCLKNGRDANHDNLHVYGMDEGGMHLGAYCFSCNFTIPSEENMQEEYEYDEEYDNMGSEFNDEVHAKLKANTGLDPRGYRGIRKDVSQYFGVRYEYDQTTGKVSKSLYPTTKDYELSGYKIRIHPKEFGNPVGEVGKDVDFFGQFRFKTHSGICVIVGGEVDQLSAYQMLKTQQKDKKYDEIAVVSSTIGESGTSKQAQAQYEWLNHFKKIIICLDNDEAGKKAAEELAEVLPKGKVFVMTMRRKDPNEYIWDKNNEVAVDYTTEFISDFWAMKAYTPAGVKSASDAFDEIEDELSKERITLPDYMEVMQEMMGGGMIQGRIANIIADTSTGKCLAKGTKVWMADGTLKSVEDVVVGDKVMGADGGPRTVLTTTTGLDTMYEVSQVDGITYTVNSAHILSLRAGYDCPGSGVKKGDVVNIPVQDYLGLGGKMKRALKGYKADLVNFGSGKPELPYLIGLWLADGTALKPEITIGNQDQELKDYLYEVAGSRGWTVNIAPSSDRSGSQALNLVGGFRTMLTKLDLIDNKHIPQEYLKGDFETRLQLLAGILDGDGYVSGKVYDLVQKSERLTNDILFLARSLGLRATVKDKFCKCQGFDGAYYKRITISGKVERVPVKLSRRKIVRSELRKNLNTAISVKCVGVGEYFGFSLDGDHLFCLEDLTVTHNSTHVNRLVHHWIFNSPVIPTIVSLEATAGQYMLEMLAIHTGKNLRWTMTDDDLKEFVNTEEGQRLKHELCFKEDGTPRFFLIDSREGSIKDIEAQMEKMYKKHNSKLFIIDVLSDLLRGTSEEHSEDHMNFQRNMVKNGATVINVLHTRKPPQSKDGEARKVSEYDALGSGTFVQSAAYNIVLNRDKLADDALTRNTTEVDLPKCRGGKTGSAGRWFFDFMTAKCYDLDKYLASGGTGV